MTASTPTVALFLGSLAAGLGAGVSATLILLGFLMLFSGDGLPWAILSQFAALAVSTGAMIGALVGFPLLALLRATSYLNITSAAIAGGVAGLGIALVIFENWARWELVLILGGTIGGICGAFALRVASAVQMRPNKSLERTREG